MKKTATFRKMKKVCFCVLIIFFIFYPITAFNQLNTRDLGLQYATEIGLATTDIREVIANVIRTALGLLGILAVVLIIYGGLLWMLSGGDKEKTDKAKKVLINGIIGLTIILMASAITRYIFNALLEGTGSRFLF